MLDPEEQKRLRRVYNITKAARQDERNTVTKKWRKITGILVSVIVLLLVIIIRLA